jgi:FMN phosphatase YigB (HAD superfamily)
MGHEKPSAGFWELIEETIGADRSELVMVGDDYMRDIEPTVARGYRAIWVATPEKRATLISRGAHTADSIDEVPALL